MQKLILTSALLGLLACQQQSATKPATAATHSPLSTPPVAVPASASIDSDAPADPAVLAQDAQQFLARYDLSKFIQMNGSGSYELMNGFFGPDNYRIQFAMLEVKPDSARPGHFWVKGKNRFKKSIMPFEGEITLTGLHNQPSYLPANDEKLSAEIKASIAAWNKRDMYCATGTFLLRETSQGPGAGTFQGKMLIDFEVDEEGELNLISRNKDYGAQSGGILLQGFWSSRDGSRRKALTLVDDIFGFNQHILSNFTIGERDPDFNPKYAKLGWNTYWQNDEWWAEPGTGTSFSGRRERAGSS
ncbi:hypothetical protein LRS06_18765 [Hymenobacter sp. J193]|uniref:hypothetical protein n=1 Tax=Hymenobacter sp. J193 TaxID=2898429 RepID=UPI002150BA09|nr:hypothetical protein [Hymenobacter sp. J193]MCR5889773.1 hypothetical protein [Hymenobacter sp. J193]